MFKGFEQVVKIFHTYIQKKIIHKSIHFMEKEGEINAIKKSSLK